MKRLLTTIIPLIIILLPSVLCAQQPHWYVLLEPGNERWYRGGNNHDFHEVVTGYQNGDSVVERTHYYSGEVLDVVEELWRIEDDGDVWMGENCYIDMPVEIGKSWGRAWGEWDQYFTRFTMMGWYDMWGPHCLWIKEVTDEGMGVEIITNRFYADGIGLVHWEVSCFMCSFHLEPVAVGTDPVSWDEVKAMYR